MTKDAKKKPKKKNIRNTAPAGITPEEHARRYVHKKYTVEVFLEAIKGSGGKKSLIMKRLNCTPVTFYQWYEAHPEIKQAVEMELDSYRNSALDLGLSNVMQLLLDKDPTTSRWVVDRLGAKAGFLPKAALTNEDGEQPISLTVNIKVDDSKITDPTG